MHNDSLTSCKQFNPMDVTADHFSLTHRDPNILADYLQRALSNEFSWQKCFPFWFPSHKVALMWSLISFSSSQSKLLHKMTSCPWIAARWSPCEVTVMPHVRAVARMPRHYRDVIMGTMTSEITSPTIVYSTVYSGAGQKHQCSASLAFVRGIHFST